MYIMGRGVRTKEHCEEVVVPSPLFPCIMHFTHNTSNKDEDRSLFRCLCGHRLGVRPECQACLRVSNREREKEEPMLLREFCCVEAKDPKRRLRQML
jgi:hypothetical protein